MPRRKEGTGPRFSFISAVVKETVCQGSAKGLFVHHTAALGWELRSGFFWVGLPFDEESAVRRVSGAEPLSIGGLS